MESIAAGLLRVVEQRRQAVSAALTSKHRATMGQFFTPRDIADFLASLLELPDHGPFRLLDPGAGVGSLSAAVAARIISQRTNLALHIVAFELDEVLIPHLTVTLQECAAAGGLAGANITYDVRHQSFIDYATGSGFETPTEYDACIANPPYKKVNTPASERVAAESIGLRASNLYTIFTGLSAALLTRGGQLSTIIPRSFANGPYHEPFRRFLLDRLSLDFVHVYEQRGELFADAEVLQENVVLRATCRPQAETVVLSTSTGASGPRIEREVRVREVLRPDDPHMFVRVPVDARTTWIAEQMAELPATLADLDVKVSTGRVVDFRAREHLRAEPDRETVPLIYPGHLFEGGITWPTPALKKPNALRRCAETEGLLLPNEPYVLVKRFSAKEEPRRVVAAVAGTGNLPGSHVAYENHLNVYHRSNRGLPILLALGLAAFLNCTLVDDYVRSFSGHTQINATDLRQLRYPSREDLVRLGAQLTVQSWPAQRELDALVAENVPAICEPADTAELAA